MPLEVQRIFTARTCACLTPKIQWDCIESSTSTQSRTNRKHTNTNMSEFCQQQGYEWTEGFQRSINPDAAKAAFEKVDANHSGTIEWNELRFALGAIGYPNDEETVKALMTMYDIDKSGHLDLQEFTQLTGYLSQTSQNFQQCQGPNAPQGQLTEQQVLQAIEAQHGGFLQRIGGSAFIQSLIVYFDRHRTGYITLGVFLVIVAVIGVLRVLHNKNQLPQENYADPSQHQSIIQRIMAWIQSTKQAIQNKLHH
ncbi:programmed cell death 6 protein-like protein [Planoprotostelium fungivorum]|uniref:Programmed cell death 6 protein-like protein n=1 Tax=Planoprotostelium fungivorum TaxID=1890364 RepID=A0A2P6MWK4_9EUKA|nr:programmed cell death 6 protein-like protein [Planoprotostelium fungivorum]